MTRHSHNKLFNKGIQVALILLLLQLSMSLSIVRAATNDDDENHPRPGNIQARGAFTCDFTIPGNVPLNVAPVIERDRMYMAARPGMQLKQIPLRFDAGGDLLSGGRYLFNTQQQAREYKEWVENDFVLDGVRFFDRPYFLNRECRAWRVIGAHNFQGLQQQVVLRSERWTVPHNSQIHTLKQRWPQIMAAAQQRGLTAAWLLYNKDEQVVQLVYFADRVVPPHPFIPDFASLGALESATALGDIFSDQSNWTKSFDRTHWVLTVWFPFVLGDHGQPSLWPNSPPLPEPFSGDGVCEVSRGESFANAPTDCGPTCGNSVCDAGENTQNCPGDCRTP